MDRSHVRLAETGGSFYHSVEHDLKVESRAADGLEHVGSSSLLVQRFGKIGGLRGDQVVQALAP